MWRLCRDGGCCSASPGHPALFAQRNDRFLAECRKGVSQATLSPVRASFVLEGAMRASGEIPGNVSFFGAPRARCCAAEINVKRNAVLDAAAKQQLELADIST